MTFGRSFAFYQCIANGGYMLLLDFICVKWEQIWEYPLLCSHSLHKPNLAIASFSNKKLENFFSFLIRSKRQFKDSNFHLNLYKILNFRQNLQLTHTKEAIMSKFINFALSQKKAFFLLHSLTPLN